MFSQNFIQLPLLPSVFFRRNASLKIESMRSFALAGEHCYKANCWRRQDDILTVAFWASERHLRIDSFHSKDMMTKKWDFWRFFAEIKLRRNWRLKKKRWRKIFSFPFINKFSYEVFLLSAILSIFSCSFDLQLVERRLSIWVKVLPNADETHGGFLNSQFMCKLIHIKVFYSLGK